MKNPAHVNESLINFSLYVSIPVPVCLVTNPKTPISIYDAKVFPIQTHVSMVAGPSFSTLVIND